jgi:hypothetical protein
VIAYAGEFICFFLQVRLFHRTTLETSFNREFVVLLRKPYLFLYTIVVAAYGISEAGQQIGSAFQSFLMLICNVQKIGNCVV